MKSSLLPLLTAIALGTGWSHAQVTTTERTDVNPDGSVTKSVTTSTGTVKAIGDGALIITGTAADQPTRYIFSDATTYVDESGRPVSVEVVKAGVPVNVHWVKRGDLYTAQKVVVKKSVTQHSDGTTTTHETTTTGEPMEATILRSAPQSITVTTRQSTDPITMVRTARTTFVDLDGNVVPAELVKADIPVKVQYTRDGSAYQASKVIVQRRVIRGGDGAVTFAPAGAVQHTETTTETRTVRESK